MTIKCQILKDAENVDNKPLMELCQWLRENGDTGFYIRYDNSDSHSSILDFGDLYSGIEEWQDPDFGGLEAGIPNPPDIREWLKKEMDAGRSMAWVSW